MASANCPTVPNYQRDVCGTTYKITAKKGGIEFLVFLDADYADNLTDFTSSSEWNAAITASQVVHIGPGKGSKGKGTPTTAILSADGIEQPIPGSKTFQITWTDYNQSHDNVDCYNSLETNGNYLYFGFIDRNNRFFGPWARPANDIDLQIEEDENGLQFHGGTVTVKGSDIAPVDLPASGINWP